MTFRHLRYRDALPPWFCLAAYLDTSMAIDAYRPLGIRSTSYWNSKRSTTLCYVIYTLAEPKQLRNTCHPKKPWANISCSIELFQLTARHKLSDCRKAGWAQSITFVQHNLSKQWVMKQKTRKLAIASPLYSLAPMDCEAPGNILLKLSIKLLSAKKPCLLYKPLYINRTF